MVENEELEKIKRKKLDKLMEKVEEKESSASNKPVVVSDSNFKEIVQNKPFMIIDCWASWCGPCRMLSPIIDELAQEYQGKILFGKLNVDENQKVAMQYQIMSIPTLLVFKKGELVDRIIGAMPKEALERKIEQYI